MKSYPEDVQAFIAENVQGTTTTDLVALVNSRFGTSFTESSMKSYKTNHKLKSGTPCGLPAGRSTDLYPTEVREFIRSHYIGVGHQGMADLLNQTFGTKYTKGQMKALYARFKLNSGRTGRFPKGNVPSNKGKKGYCAPGSEKGWFPKGNQPRNHRAVGDEALRDDGYVWIKIAEPNKWRQKHVVIWEAANGPRPPKHGIIFGDGNRFNFALENLLLVSQAQLLALNRNHLIKNDVDLTRIGILIVDVDRKIHERKSGNKMGKRKISDEQIIEKLQDPSITSYRQVAQALGTTPSGDFNNTCRQLCKRHGIPEKVQKNGRKPAVEEKPKKQKGNNYREPLNLETLPEVKSPPSLQDPAPIVEESTPEPVKLDPFPFAPKDDVIYGGQLHRVRSVGKTQMILCRNADLKGVTITLEDYNSGRAQIRMAGEKPQIRTTGEDIMLKNRRADEEPEGAKAPETIFERVAIKNPDRKPATANKDFEECFKPIDQALDITDKAKERLQLTAEDMAQFENIQDLNKYLDEVCLEGSGLIPSDAGPIHIDLEIEDSADLVELKHDEDEDYPDPDWFDKPIPRKGTVERAIWDKAYREIGEIQTLRATIQTALSQGKQLPAVYVDKYNRYVSKYSEEAGA